MNRDAPPTRGDMDRRNGAAPAAREGFARKGGAGRGGKVSDRGAQSKEAVKKGEGELAGKELQGALIARKMNMRRKKAHARSQG